MLCGLLRLIPLVLLVRLLSLILLVPLLTRAALAGIAADTAVVAADARAALADAAADTAVVAAAADPAGDLYRRACRVRRRCGLHVPRSARSGRRFWLRINGQGMAAVGPVHAPVEIFRADEATLQVA